MYIFLSSSFRIWRKLPMKCTARLLLWLWTSRNTQSGLPSLFHTCMDTREFVSVFKFVFVFIGNQILMHELTMARMLFVRPFSPPPLIKEGMSVTHILAASYNNGSCVSCRQPSTSLLASYVLRPIFAWCGSDRTKHCTNCCGRGSFMPRKSVSRLTDLIYLTEIILTI